MSLLDSHDDNQDPSTAELIRLLATTTQTLSAILRSLERRHVRLLDAQLGVTPPEPKQAPEGQPRGYQE